MVSRLQAHFLGGRIARHRKNLEPQQVAIRIEAALYQRAETHRVERVELQMQVLQRV